MNENNLQPVTLFHDALTLVQYPGIAQVDLNNFRSCFLNEINILSSLRWLYMKGLDKITSADRNPNPTRKNNEDLTVNLLTADEKFLTNWYFQSGICTNEKVLQSQSPSKDQFDTFINLYDYIMNVLYSEVEFSSKLITWNIFEKYFDNEINFTPLSYNLTHYIRSDNLKPYMKNLKKTDIIKNVINDNSMKKELISLTNETDSNSTIESQRKGNQPVALLSFCENFKNFESGIDSRSLKKNKKTHATSLVENRSIIFSDLNKVVSAKVNLQHGLVQNCLKSEKSLLHSISEDIVNQFNILTKLHDVD